MRLSWGEVYKGERSGVSRPMMTSSGGLRRSARRVHGYLPSSASAILPCIPSGPLRLARCGPMPAQLLALTDGPSLILDKPILLISRHRECDIQLNSRKVSRRHCCIAQVSDYLVVRDLGSTNRIRINGERVLEGRLRGGDELTVGNFRYQVFLQGRR